jgi:hypothetical protein
MPPNLSPIGNEWWATNRELGWETSPLVLIHNAYNVNLTGAF